MVKQVTFVIAFLLVMAGAALARRNLVCYYATWATYRPGRGQFDVDHIDPFMCTHLMYAFFGLDDDASIRYLDPWLDLPDNWGRDNIRRFNALKHVNPNLRTLAVIGGDTQKSEIFSRVAANPGLRQRFAENCRDFCLRHGFDGVDINWEFPGQRGGNPAIDRANFVLMLADIRRVISPSGLILTGAVGAPQNIAEVAYDIAAVAQQLDWINLMTYDYNGGWDTFTGHNAPLFAGPSDWTDFQQMLNVHHSVSFWLSRGAPASKINLGIPFYGRTFTLADSNNHWLRAGARGPGHPGEFTQEEGFLAYYEICPHFTNGNWRRFWESQQQIPFGVIGDQWIGYDDMETMAHKSNYILHHHLAGGMVWSIDMDDHTGFCGPRFTLLGALNRYLN